MMRAVRGALARARPHERVELARWAAGRLLLGYAREAGFAHAAVVAYRWADTLAGAIR